MQNAATGLNTIGSAGQALAMQGVPNSMIVEFDTYDNGVAASDIANDHTAISLNGNLASPVLGPVDASTTSVNIEDGIDHRIDITWDPSTLTFKVYFDTNLRLTYTNDLVTNVFGGNPLVYWGFSSSTGFHTNTQTICPGNLPGGQLPVIFNNFFITDEDGKVALRWSTSEEKDVKEFVVERSDDGQSFYTLGNVAPHENTNGTGKYYYKDMNTPEGTAYYRIKEVDIDEKFTYSEIRAVKLDQELQSGLRLFPNPVNKETNVVVDYAGEEGIIIVYDSYGREIIKANMNTGKNNLTISPSMESGVYQVVVQSGTGINRSYLTIIK
jgi:hypothetical protein